MQPHKLPAIELHSCAAADSAFECNQELLKRTRDGVSPSMGELASP